MPSITSDARHMPIVEALLNSLETNCFPMTAQHVCVLLE
ncbi:hypothetical protein EV380_0394 [Zhihengliuella halotolerans]|uniref:Uncharacterized protein n=1 Tax=Zhihengliuella halotolerans TaxID=370736 RepID=A0A4Q8AB98_9MICC|nr:hypothetical protein EV380_0394 [Zhihengliuella halotolerans]